MAHPALFPTLSNLVQDALRGEIRAAPLGAGMASHTPKMFSGRDAADVAFRSHRT